MGYQFEFADVLDKWPLFLTGLWLTLLNFLAAIGLRKNEPQLLGWVDDWVRTGLKDGSLDTIYKKSLKEDLPQQILDGAR